MKRYDYLSLVALAMLFFIFSGFFNFTSGVAENPEGKTLGEKYHLLGPDPYYHARVVEKIYEEGKHPYWLREQGNRDPLLNYPIGLINPRPPLFDWSVAVFAKMLSPFVENDTDAMGLALQFAAPIWGCLLVIPIFLIGKELFEDEKVGLLGALLYALMPVQIAGGHGAPFALADHDSFTLFLICMAFYFYIRSMNLSNSKEWINDYRKRMELKKGLAEFARANKTSLMYAALAGVMIGAVGLAWEGFQLPLAVLALYAFVQLVVDKCRRKDSLYIFFPTLIVFAVSLLMVLPYYVPQNTLGPVQIGAFMMLALVVAGAFLIPTRKIPAIIILPVLAGIAGGLLVILWVIQAYFSDVAALAPVIGIAETLFGGLPYVQLNKIYLTIAEAARTTSFSWFAMSFGPVVFWLPFITLAFLLLKIKREWKPAFLFVLVWVCIDLYLSSTAGRFINNLVPMFSVLGGWFVVKFLRRIKLKAVLKEFKGRKKFTSKLATLVKPLVLILFIAAIFIPNAFLAADASIPGEIDVKFGTNGAYGISFVQERYWTDALSSLAAMDTEVEPEERPGFISWWDYGFYEALIGKHPTVADNFQSGIPPAANFITAVSEEEATAVMITRLLEGYLFYEKPNSELMGILSRYAGSENAERLIEVLENPTHAKEYGKKINPEFAANVSDKFREFVTVRAENAKYRESVEILSSIGDEKITQLYMDIQDFTGNEIRYYGVEQRDYGIFGVFTFLADRSLVQLGADEDDYVAYYQTPEGQVFPIYKGAFYDTMMYRTFIGKPQIVYMEIEQLPCYGLSHWLTIHPDSIQTDKNMLGAIVIAKYYEGAFVNGTVNVRGKSPGDLEVWLLDERGIPHDMREVDKNRRFSLISIPGNVTVSVRLNGIEVGRKTLDGSGELAPISEQEALRKTPDFSREIRIDVSESSIASAEQQIQQAQQMQQIQQMAEQENVPVIDSGEARPVQK